MLVYAQVEQGNFCIASIQVMSLLLFLPLQGFVFHCIGFYCKILDSFFFCPYFWSCYGDWVLGIIAPVMFKFIGK